VALLLLLLPHPQHAPAVEKCLLYMCAHGTLPFHTLSQVKELSVLLVRVCFFFSNEFLTHIRF
jgi:hypothetical protein